ALALPDRARAAAIPRAVSPTPVVGSSVSLIDSLRGRSRKLRARFVNPLRIAALPVLRELFGDSAGHRAGVQVASSDQADIAPFSFITMRPFADKVRGRIGAYRIGFFPSEQRSTRSSAYANPEGFLEVTTGNQDTPVSDHFRLRDFLTHDQGTVWPKYLVLREPLVDKLELVMDELRDMGVPVERLRVMSGFRTPQYNAQGVGAGGRAQDSRHQYGDAADVYVVNGSRDWMSDLDRNGKIDTRDARLLAMAADRVERAHPDLVGGVGVYPATSAHGPFVHIDVRGTKARWGAL
ncbi:MAG: D-Ala-D-Ala carboxypeptidase family metallohydrolase, partial [Gemmatimonas sp.]